MRDPFDLPERSRGLFDERERYAELGAVPHAGLGREVSTHGQDEPPRDHEAQAVARGVVLDVRYVKPIEERSDVIRVEPRPSVDERDDGPRRVCPDPNSNGTPARADADCIVEERLDRGVRAHAEFIGLDGCSR